MKRLLYLGCVILSIVIAALLLILTTPLGLQWSAPFLKTMLPGTLEYKQITGMLMGSIEVRQLRYTYHNTIFTAHTFEVSWQPMQLLHRKLLITNIKANTVQWTTKPIVDETAVPQTPPPHPQGDRTYSLVLRHADIRDLVIETRHAIKVPHLSLQGKIAPKHFALTAESTITQPIPLEANWTLSGPSIEQYALHIQLEDPDHQHLFWRLTGTGGRHHLNVRLQQGKTLGGDTDFILQLDWKNAQTRWDLLLHASDLRISELLPQWPNIRTLDLATRGTLSASPRYTVNTRITAADAHLFFAVQQTEALHVKWQFAAQQLSQLWPGIQGTAQSKGEWLWEPKQHLSTFSGTVEGKDIAAFGYRAGGLQGDWLLYTPFNIPSPPWGRGLGRGESKTSIPSSVQPAAPLTQSAHPVPLKSSYFNGSIQDFEGGGGIQWKNLSLRGSGRPTAHQLTGQVSTTQAALLAFQLQGGFFKSSWKGQLQKFTILSKLQLGQWRLSRPAALTVSHTQLAMDPLCLNILPAITPHSTAAPMPPQGKLCLNAAWQTGHDWNVKFDGQDINLSPVTSLFLPPLRLTSNIDLMARVSGQGRQPNTLSAQFQLHPGHLYYHEDQQQQPPLDIPIQRGQATIQLNKNRLDTQAELLLHSNSWLRMNLQATPPQPGADLSVWNTVGQINAQLLELKPLEALWKDFAKPVGQTELTLSIKGPLAQPSLSGNLHYNGTIALPTVGIVLSQINMKALLEQNRIKYTVTTYSKDEPLTLQGQADWSADQFNSISTLLGQDVLVMNTPEYIVYASPALKLVTQGKTIAVTGRIDIPSSLIQPHTHANVVKLPEDQIVYVDQPAKQDPKWTVSTHLDVHLGDAILLRMAGLSARLTGEGNIMGTPGKIMLANGRIRVVEGSYDAYDKQLTIMPGSLIQFVNSPLNNPNIDIRATKTISTTNIPGQKMDLDTVIVGLHLTGPLQSPDIEPFSIPADLSEADIISYLILGYSIDNGNVQALSFLLEAVNALKFGGGSSTQLGVISELRKGLGLTELGIQADTMSDILGTPVDDQMSFVIGKKLTKNIYLRYSLGLGGSSNVFRLIYVLSKNWSIQTNATTATASTNSESGGDILYTLETG